MVRFRMEYSRNQKLGFPHNALYSPGEKLKVVVVQRARSVPGSSERGATIRRSDTIGARIEVRSSGVRSSRRAVLRPC